MPPRDGGGPCKCCCKWCICFPISVALFFLLQFKTSSPACSIEQFDVFALQGITNSTHLNDNIHYDLKLKNRKANINKGIYYDALNLTFYYKPNLNSFPIGIGNATFSPFYQGRGKGTHRVGDFEPRGVQWENATAPVVFSVELATAVRYKNSFWKTKRHRLVVRADLEVNEQGSLVKGKDNKGIRLSSKSGRNDKGRFELVGMLGVLIFIHSL